jgi:hypothetical protein
MPAIKITTTTGQYTIDPAEIDSLTYRLGGQEKTVEGANVIAMFIAFMAADEGHKVREDERRQLADVSEQHRQLSDAKRRKLLGG